MNSVMTGGRKEWLHPRLYPVWGVSVVLALIGAIFLLVVVSQNKRLDKTLSDKKQVLRQYLNDARLVPTEDMIQRLQDHKNYIENQLSSVIHELKSKGDFAERFPEVAVALDVRELVAKLQAKFVRLDIAMEDYEVDVPSAQDVPHLKRYLALIDEFLTLAEQVQVIGVEGIERVPYETVQDNGKEMFRRYPVVFHLRCQSEALMRLLHALTTHQVILLVDGLELTSLPDYVLDVRLKVSYVEVLK